MKSTAIFVVLGLSLAGAGALALSPRATDDLSVDEARVQEATEVRLRHVFEGLLAAERAQPNGAPRASR